MSKPTTTIPFIFGIPGISIFLFLWLLSYALVYQVGHTYGFRESQTKHLQQLADTIKFIHEHCNK